MANSGTCISGVKQVRGGRRRCRTKNVFVDNTTTKPIDNHSLSLLPWFWLSSFVGRPVTRNIRLCIVLLLVGLLPVVRFYTTHQINHTVHTRADSNHNLDSQSQATVMSKLSTEPPASTAQEAISRSGLSLATDQTTTETNTIMYSVLRRDRSGAVIHDMLLAHAHAFARNWTYGGACCCIRGEPPSFAVQKLLNQTQNLLMQILGPVHGLSFLPLACPQREEQAQLASLSTTTTTTKIVPSKVYRGSDRPNRAVFTAAWKRHVQQRYIGPALSTSHLIQDQQKALSSTGYQLGSRDDEDDDHPLVVAVHVRRGDVNPCNGSKQRYLPNSHYQRILQHHVLSHDHHDNQHGNTDSTGRRRRRIVIKIHSQRKSFEPWTDRVDYWMGQFENNKDQSDKNDVPSPLVQVQVLLDAPLHEAWHDMMTADILVLSRSSFSYVPAILHPEEEDGVSSSPRNHHHQVIYTPFWNDPLPGWTVVDEDLVQATQQDLEDMRKSDRCREWEQNRERS